MKLQLTTKHRFNTDEKRFDLFCIENDFAKYFASYVSIYLIKYFV